MSRSYGAPLSPAAVTVWTPSSKPSGTSLTQPSTPCDAGGETQLAVSSVPVTPWVTSPVGLPASIVNVSVTGSSGGGGGVGLTPDTASENTCRSPTWIVVLVLPSGASAKNRTYDVFTGLSSLKVR